ncbi:hypothetical protein VSR01_31135 [Actinacidiphila sp. DG2A-62]|uniref:hypothetical protein n=1 Tax=Actinacidiphila sp. DG2A-62 TaxID=3108821 RepID=UPI002DB5ECAE|nr:hypothetical protein [Actinacidiphila sp. DG2A-62]MEC3997705.1 hypothetical protein [Actinacidiphila sp. DG2A-62]
MNSRSARSACRTWNHAAATISGYATTPSSSQASRMPNTSAVRSAGTSANAAGRPPSAAASTANTPSARRSWSRTRERT